MDDKQQAIIRTLKSNGCNVSDAIKKNDSSMREFNDFMQDKEFQQGFEDAERIKDDYANTQFMKLIQQGDKSAILQYHKQQYEKSKNDSQSGKRDQVHIGFKSRDLEYIKQVRFKYQKSYDVTNISLRDFAILCVGMMQKCLDIKSK